ncbi:MAG: Ig-like domain-containing protein, partial [Patescibacteria group bacterium]
GTISYIDENNKTTVVFSPASYLDKNIEYTMTIKKEIKNRDGLTMASDAIWTFTTGSALCQMDHIKITINNIEKNDDLFTCADNNCIDDFDTIISAGNQHKYIAQAVDKDKNNILAQYIWEKKDDINGIISDVKNSTTTGDSNDNQDFTSQRKNGEAIILVQANATGIPSKATRVAVKSLMCENPWNFNDSETSFKINYCRDK